MTEDFICGNCGVAFSRSVKPGPKPTYCSSCAKIRKDELRRESEIRIRSTPEGYAKYLENAKRYRDKHWNEVKQLNARWRTLNPDYQREWRERNPDKAMAYVGRRRLKTKRISNDDWYEILLKQKNLCALCGAYGRLTRDHVIPISRGGTDDLDNIQALCRSCNSRKQNRTNEEYLSNVKITRSWRGEL